MNIENIGSNIARLRKRAGFTQQTLAEKLNISNKSISKWELGNGYPDIWAVSQMAELFGVTVDYLMFGPKKGIAIAGNIIADIVKSIDTFPKRGMMSYVKDISHAVGGCVPNTAINLAKIDRGIPIHAFGKIGTDDNGRYIISQLLKNGISVEGISYSHSTPTSFCDVMSEPMGERTFFHKKGANAEFSPQDIDTSAIDCKLLHIGYILLLDVFDKPDRDFGTVMARFLSDVQKSGIKTSIDVVSDNDANYAEKIKPALRYTNYAIMNETESCRVFDLNPYDENGNLIIENVKKAMLAMGDCGVRDKVIVHSKKASFVLDVQSEAFTAVGSLEIPKEEIKGSVGAGDAFCAGCLYGIYNDFDDGQILEFASAAAACSLFAANSVDGMKSKQEILALMKKYGRLKI